MLEGIEGQIAQAQAGAIAVDSFHMRWHF